MSLKIFNDFDPNWLYRDSILHAPTPHAPVGGSITGIDQSITNNISCKEY